MIINLSIDEILKWAGLLATLGLVVWYIIGFRKLTNKEAEILKVKDEVDNLEHDDKSKSMIHSGMISQPVFEKRTEIRRKPLVDRFERLKLERQFILDKLPLAGVFKH